MRLTQGTFSFLPDLADGEIQAQIEYCLEKGWAVNIEYTDDPHPRNTYWEMFGLPMFDQRDVRPIMAAIEKARGLKPDCYIKVNAHDSSRGRETVALSFIVNRPANEPGFMLERQEGPGRTIRYRLRSYATDKPETERYK